MATPIGSHFLCCRTLPCMYDSNRRRNVGLVRPLNLGKGRILSGDSAAVEARKLPSAPGSSRSCQCRRWPKNEHILKAGDHFLPFLSAKSIVPAQLLKDFFDRDLRYEPLTERLCVTCPKDAALLD